MARFDIPDGWRAQAYRFALDPSPDQVRVLQSHCGAARFAFNHLLDVVKANLDQRAAERCYGVADQDLTPAQGWSLAQLRKTWNQIKTEWRRGGQPTARRPTTRGWTRWRGPGQLECFAGR